MLNNRQMLNCKRLMQTDIAYLLQTLMLNTMYNIVIIKDYVAANGYYVNAYFRSSLKLSLQYLT